MSAITFVQDYIQIAFDGPFLSLIAEPEVSAHGRAFTPLVPGFRDALCSLIGKTVEEARAEEGLELRLSFATGELLTVSLRDAAHSAGPEAVVFQSGDGAFDVW